MIYRHSATVGRETWRRVEEITPPGAMMTTEWHQRMRDLGHKAYCTMACGHECAIGIAHTISPEGVINPSLQCPALDSKCSSHVSGIVFEGWSP